MKPKLGLRGRRDSNYSLWGGEDSNHRFRGGGVKTQTRFAGVGSQTIARFRGEKGIKLSFGSRGLSLRGSRDLN